MAMNHRAHVEGSHDGRPRIYQWGDQFSFGHDGQRIDREQLLCIIFASIFFDGFFEAVFIHKEGPF